MHNSLGDTEPLTWKKEHPPPQKKMSWTGILRSPMKLSLTWGRWDLGLGGGRTLLAWGQGWSSFLAKLLAQKRRKRAYVHRSQPGPRAWEQNLLGLCVSASTKQSLSAWPGARGFSMAPAPTAGRKAAASGQCLTRCLLTAAWSDLLQPHPISPSQG